jgi:hypothetical protein
MHIPEVTPHVPETFAALTGNKQFEPTSETHHFGFVVKAVDPGCTLEVQIEERDGRVTRLTTTESTSDDREAIRAAIAEAVERFITNFRI